MRRTLRRAAALWGMTAVMSASFAGADIYGDVDFLLLAPKVPSIGFRNTFYDRDEGQPEPAAEGTLGDDLYFATRLTLGAEDCCGFGGRFRWFSFDNSVPYDGLWDTGSGTIALAGDTGLDVDAFDFDLTQRGRIGCWNIVGGAGLRYASADLNNRTIDFSSIPAFIAGLAAVRFDGVGPTLALEGRRALADSGLSLYAAGRTAFLFGDIDVYSPFRTTNLFTVQDDSIQIWEIQMGVDYAATLPNGFTAETGVFWETQHWDYELSELTFIGLGIHTGIRY